MVNKKYKVLRSRVYYGEVIIPKEFGTRNNGERGIYEYTPLRHMIYELQEDGTAVDLLNKCPNYKVFDKREDLEIGETIVYGSLKLEDILDYLGYLEELGYSDIKNIRSELFSGHLVSDNPEIFGLVEVQSKNGQVRFVKENESLVDEYFKRRFDTLRQRTLLESLQDNLPMDTFKLSNKEKKKRLGLRI